MSKDNESGIYCIENKVNNKKYIGQAFNINERWNHHKSALRNNRHKNEHLQSSWNKYGEDNFDFYILEECSLDNLDARETYYINYFNSIDSKYGYNLRSGGQNGGAKYSEESRKKMSDAQKKLDQSPDRIELLRKNSLEVWQRDGYKESRSGENHPFYGKHHTEETRKKISDANKGKPHGEMSKSHREAISIAKIGKKSSKRNMTPVLCVELNEIFEDAITAGKELNIKSPNHVIDVCMKRRETCGGYHFEFVENMGNNI